MTKKITEALIYCRISDTKQKTDGHGLESQAHRCYQFAENNRLTVAREPFFDDVSGGGDFNKRPAMNELLDYLKRNRKTDYVVIFDDIKRFSRDVYFYWDLIKKLEKYDATPMSPNFRFERTPEGRFQQSITVAAGEYERESNARQSHQKSKARLEAGYHAFNAPVGFKFEKIKGVGKLLMRDEPAASIVAEVMEGFASGRFQTKNEVRRFLEEHPQYPKDASGKLGNSHVERLFNRPLYAGYIEYKPWGVSLRKGQHEGLISYETYLKIQERLKGRAYAPTRKNLNKDFPLHGAVNCGSCGNALTFNWSRSHTGKRHAYYICQNRKCDYKGKSIRRDLMEGEFEKLLKTLTPSKELIMAADKMFKQLWQHREHTEKQRKQAWQQQHKEAQNSIEKLLDRIVDADSPAVMKALEKRVVALEGKQRVIDEKIANCGRPVRPYDEMYRTSLLYLANPHKLWALGGYEGKRTVLKLTFTDRLTWERDGAYRTPDLSLPFKALGGSLASKKEMADRTGLEPATSGVTGRHSNQLNYRSVE